jgi:hypothetical protein
MSVGYSLTNHNDIKFLSCPLSDDYKNLYFVSNLENLIQPDKWGDSIHNWYTVPAWKILNKTGLKYFKDVNHVNIFRCKANQAGPIHIDKQTTTAINWIIQGEGLHQWFNPESCKVLRYNRAGNEIYDPESAELIYQTDSQFMRVNTRIPHRIVCTSEVDRICVSVRTSYQI